MTGQDHCLAEHCTLDDRDRWQRPRGEIDTVHWSLPKQQDRISLISIRHALEMKKPFLFLLFSDDFSLVDSCTIQKFNEYSYGQSYGRLKAERTKQVNDTHIHPSAHASPSPFSFLAPPLCLSVSLSLCLLPQCYWTTSAIRYGFETSGNAKIIPRILSLFLALFSPRALSLSLCCSFSFHLHAK